MHFYFAKKPLIVSSKVLALKDIYLIENMRWWVLHCAKDDLNFLVWKKNFFFFRLNCWQRIQRSFWPCCWSFYVWVDLQNQDIWIIEAAPVLLEVSNNGWMWNLLYFKIMWINLPIQIPLVQILPILLLDLLHIKLQIWMRDNYYL